MGLRHHQIDAGTAERILAATTGVDEVPAELRAVASLLSTAALLPASEPDPAMLAAMARQAMAPASSIGRSRRSVLAKAVSLRAAAATAVVTLAATGAAAAAGALPDAAQDGIAKAASHLGVDLPDSAGDQGREHTGSPGAPSDSHGGDVSTVATGTESTGRDKGAEISTAARDGHGRPPTESGPSGSEAEKGEEAPAPVATPHLGGTATADAASGGASTVGTARADDAAVRGPANAADHPSAAVHPPSR